MNSIRTEFVLAQQKIELNDHDRLAARPIRAGVHELQVAVDTAGRRHLLIPSKGAVTEDNRSRGVRLLARDLVDQGRTSTYCDLVCEDSALEAVFERLVEDVVDAIEQQQSRDPQHVARYVLREWRHLLAAASTPLPETTLVGLIGELEVLLRLMNTDPLVALDAWVGCLGEAQDFRFEGRAIEVKTNTARSPQLVQISSLAQLDPAPYQRLDLVVVTVQLDGSGLSVDDLVTAVIDAGVPPALLRDKLSEVGFVSGAPGTDSVRARVVDVRAWKVADDMPTLRLGALPREASKAIGAVKYELRLDGITRFSTDLEGSLAALLGVGSS